MSQRALLLATRDVIRNQAGLASEECDVTFDGRPPAMAGERFVSVWPGIWVSRSELNLSEEFGVNVTLTMRVRAVAQDREGTELATKDGEGFSALLEKLRAVVHQNFTIMNTANTMIGTNANGFIGALSFQSGGSPAVVGSSWWLGGGGKDNRAGMAQTLAFAGAVREQVIESQT